MYLKELQIRNYKNFHKARFLFNKGSNVIIGENDSGKSNMMRAIRLVLDKKMNWYEKEISEDMFCRKIESWKKEVIIISLRFAEIDCNYETQAMLKYRTSNSTDEGAITLFCMPNSKMRNDIKEASKDLNKLKQLFDRMTIKDYNICYSFGSNKDYLDDETYKKIVGYEENGKYVYENELDAELFGEISNNISDIRNNLIDFTYIDALRDAIFDLKQKYNPLMTMLKGIENKIEQTEKEKVENIVKDLNDSISDIKEIQKMSIEINNKITESVGNTYSPNIKIKSNLSNDLKNIFQNINLKSQSNEEFDIDKLGLGTTNIIYIALKLLEYSYNAVLNFEEEKYFLLLFEEPEAHLHKHIQMSLFEKTASDNNNVQIIMSTHSDNISASSKISDMNILIKKQSESLAVQPWKGLDKDTDIVRIERYLDVKRSELLFSRSVILVEGDSEEILIPNMVKKVLGISLDEIGISLINIGSVGFANIYKLFNEERIIKKCAIITDLDTPTDIDDEKQITASALGITRKATIDSENDGNEFVKGFYATHTLEVDILENNIGYYERLIDKVYIDKSTIIKRKNDINSLDLKTRGKAILSIVNHSSKGWNAVIFSDLLDYNFEIPNYILDAVIFASKEELKNINNLKSLATFILGKLGKSDIVGKIDNGEYNNIEELKTLLPTLKQSNNKSLKYLLSKLLEE